MTEKEKAYVRGTFSDEGMLYALTCYTQYTDIKDEEFHKLRQAFLKAAKDLAAYVEYTGVIV